MLTLAMPQSLPDADRKQLAFAHVSREDGRGQPCADGILQGDGVVQIGVAESHRGWAQMFRAAAGPSCFGHFHYRRANIDAGQSAAVPRRTECRQALRFLKCRLHPAKAPRQSTVRQDVRCPADRRWDTEAAAAFSAGNKAVIKAVMDKQPPQTGAALSRWCRPPKTAPRAGQDRQVGLVAYDRGIVAPQFKDGLGKAPMPPPVPLCAAHCCASSGGDQRDARIGNQCCANIACADDDLRKMPSGASSKSLSTLSSKA
jgi:hypothetical protein